VKRLSAYVIDAIVVYAIIGLAVAAAVLPAFLAGILVPGYSPRVFRSGPTLAHSRPPPHPLLHHRRGDLRQDHREEGHGAPRHHGDRREAAAGRLVPSGT
jgi:hypothetical protein